MKYITLLLMLLPLQVGAFELLDSYKGIPILYSETACNNDTYSMCYHWDKEIIIIQKYNLEREYRFNLDHEFAHPIFRNELTQEQQLIWRNLSEGMYDEWLEEKGFDTRATYFSERAKYDYEEDFSETYAALQNNAFVYSDTKFSFKLRLVRYFTKDLTY